MEVRAVYFPYLCFRREVCFIYVIKMDARFGFLKLNGNLVCLACENGILLICLFFLSKSNAKRQGKNLRLRTGENTYQMTLRHCVVSWSW